MQIIFHDAYNCLITIGAEFTVKKNGELKRYKFSAGDSIWIKVMDDFGEWRNYKPSAIPEDFKAILPDGFDYNKLVTALTFWEQGFNAGKVKRND